MSNTYARVKNPPLPTLVLFPSFSHLMVVYALRMCRLIWTHWLLSVYTHTQFILCHYIVCVCVCGKLQREILFWAERSWYCTQVSYERIAWIQWV